MPPAKRPLDRARIRRAIADLHAVAEAYRDVNDRFGDVYRAVIVELAHADISGPEGEILDELGRFLCFWPRPSVTAIQIACIQAKDVFLAEPTPIQPEPFAQPPQLEVPHAKATA